MRRARRCALRATSCSRVTAFGRSACPSNRRRRHRDRYTR